MKKLLIVLFLVGLGFAQTPYQIWSSKMLVDSATDTSSIYQISGQKGYFSTQCEKTKAGKLQLEFLVSNDCVTFIKPSTSANIFDSLESTSGSASNGKDLVSFSPPPAFCLKFVATEITADTSIFSCWYWSP